MGLTVGYGKDHTAQWNSLWAMENTIIAQYDSLWAMENTIIAQWDLLWDSLWAMEKTIAQSLTKIANSFQLEIQLE